jgi:hypothetical protein
MTKDEALRLALEALEDLGMKHYGNTGEVLYKETFTAVKAALEEKDEKDGSPCPEFWDWLPKAYRNGDADDLPKFTKYNMEVAFLAGKQSVALEAKDEPVAWVYPEFWQHLENLNCGTAYRLTGIGRQPLYTTPPQRTWVGLTDEEISDCMEMSIQKTCRAIEAKLKAKNT